MPTSVTTTRCRCTTAYSAFVISTADLLAFERTWLNRRQHDGAKAQAIKEAFGVSVTRYYQQLVAAIDTAEALALDPVTAGIIRRRRDSRMKQRRR